MENGMPESDTVQKPQSASSDQVPEPKKRPSKWLWIMLVALFLALAAGGAYWWVAQTPKSKQPAVQSNTSNQEPGPTATQPTSITTKHYISNGKDLNLEFDYPDGWTVSPESGNNSSDQTITITSPLVSLTGANGTAVTGRAIVSIRRAASGAKELNTADSATIAQDSVQIAYKTPTSVQHQYPYLTFIHFADSGQEPGAFEEVMITGVRSYKKGETITGPSTSPIISASFYQCSTDACSGSGAKLLSITYNVWQNTAHLQQVQNLFTSLKIN